MTRLLMRYVILLRQSLPPASCSLLPQYDTLPLPACKQCIVPAPILPLGIDGSHPALRSLSLDVGQGIVAFGFQDEMHIRLALKA